MNKRWESGKPSLSMHSSKDDRLVLRIAAVLHVLFDQLQKLLRGHRVTPSPKQISECTFEAAMKLVKYFGKQKDILSKVSELGLFYAWQCAA